MPQLLGASGMPTRSRWLIFDGCAARRRGKKQRDELEAQYIAEVATLRQTAEEEEAAAQMREDAAVKVQAACKQDARISYEHIATVARVW